MTSQQITHHLQSIAHSDDFAYRSEELTDALSAASGGLETVEPILRFMEAHPSIDYGMPGPLVHYVETFYQKGYEAKLIESIERRPTSHTLWMLNRIINGTADPAVRRQLIVVMQRARVNPTADEEAVETANDFLEEFGV